jgi:hypothetical protein
MKLTELRRSSSQQGGWLFKGTPKREVKAYFKDCWPEVKYLERYGLWWVCESQAGGYLDIFDNFREVARDAGLIDDGRQRQQEQPKPPPQRETLSSFGAMYLRDNAPNEVVDAAYRALAKMRHPDLARDDVDRRERTEAMKRLNTAYEACKKGRGRA